MTLMKCRGVGWVGVMGSDISALIIGQVKDELQVKELICSIGYIIRGRSMKYSKIVLFTSYNYKPVDGRFRNEKTRASKIIRTYFILRIGRSTGCPCSFCTCTQKV